MKHSKFTKKVVASIEQFFDEQYPENQAYLNCELDLQMNLLSHLWNKWPYYLELWVPTNSKKFKDNVKSKEDFPWRTKEGDLQEMCVDLVVRDGDEFLPIEIRYACKGYVGDFLLFGRPEKQMTIRKKQGAQDREMYGFWKDVHFVEMLCKTYPTVKNGIVIFVTNDPYYIENPKGKNADKVNYYAFRMTEGRTASGLMAYSKIAHAYPTFKLDGQYTIHWEPFGTRGFSYCMVTI